MTPSILYSKSKFHYLMVPYPEKPKEGIDYFDVALGSPSKVAAMASYSKTVAASLASAVEFDEEGQAEVKRLCYNAGLMLDKWYPQFEAWAPSDGQRFTVEGIETEVEKQGWGLKDLTGEYSWGKLNNPDFVGQTRQVVRLKAKPESEDSYLKLPSGTVIKRAKEKLALKEKAGRPEDFPWPAKDSAPPEPCKECGGSGEISKPPYDDSDTCPYCKGTGCEPKTIEPDRGKEHLPKRDESDRDWPEDYDQENGNYQNKCVYCGLFFYGNKHRAVCKKCQDSKEGWISVDKLTSDELNKEFEKVGLKLDPEMKEIAKANIALLDEASKKIEDPHPAPLAKGEWTLDEVNRCIFRGDDVLRFEPYFPPRKNELAELQAIAVQLNSGEGENGGKWMAVASDFPKHGAYIENDKIRLYGDYPLPELQAIAFTLNIGTEEQEEVWTELQNFLIIHARDLEYLKSKYTITRKP